MYNQSSSYQERESRQSRDRSRDRKHHFRSPSNDSPIPQSKYQSKPKEMSYRPRKHVKFEQSADIKVFRKEDEPVAKGLSEEEIIELKGQMEKENSKMSDFNWDQNKHKEALSQSNSIKEVKIVDYMKQKEKEKLLTEKLVGVREGISFYAPLTLRTNNQTSVSSSTSSLSSELGINSLQRLQHDNRISNILGCYYTQPSEIPNQPQFQLLNNTNISQTKIIKFDKQSFNFDSLALSNKSIYTQYEGLPNCQKEEKAIKGILKVSQQLNSLPKVDLPISVAQMHPQHKMVDPHLIFLIKDFKLNPNQYPKEKYELLLKPYKDNGELDYLMKNKNVLDELLKPFTPQPMGYRTVINNPTTPNPNFGSNPNPNPNLPPIQHPIMRSQSPNQQPFYGMRTHNNPYNNHMNNGGQMRNSNERQMYGTYVSKAEKFRTVPCKYFHSPQGCSKTQNCTFIHDEKYVGKPIPNQMSRYNNNPNPYEGSGSLYQPHQGTDLPDQYQTSYTNNFANREANTSNYGNREANTSNYGNREANTLNYGNREANTSGYREGNTSANREGNTYGNRQGNTSSYGNREGNPSSYGNREGNGSNYYQNYNNNSMMNSSMMNPNSMMRPNEMNQPNYQPDLRNKSIYHQKPMQHYNPQMQPPYANQDQYQVNSYPMQNTYPSYYGNQPKPQ